MWLVVGLIAGLSVLAYVELNRRFSIDWKGWTGLILGEVAILFGIAWTVASVFEGEPRAASMGAMMFGGMGLVILVLAWRLFIEKSARPAE
jgi:hypothetical protein